MRWCAPWGLHLKFWFVRTGMLTILVNEVDVEVQPEILTVPDRRQRIARSTDDPLQGQGRERGRRALDRHQQLRRHRHRRNRLSSDLAWRGGAVVFDSEPTGQAIAEIQRYTDARITISDPSIANLPVGSPLPDR